MKLSKIDLLKMSKPRLIERINRLENDKETLEDLIKSELYKTFMNKIDESIELERLKKENKNLRQKNKTLKSIIKGD